MSTSSGFETGITPDKVFEAHIRSDEIGGTSDWNYVSLNIDQITDSPVDIDIIAIMFNGRYQENDAGPRTVLV